MRRLESVLLILIATCLIPTTEADEAAPVQVNDRFVADFNAAIESEDDLEPDDDSENEEPENPCDSPDSSVVTLLSCVRSGSREERLMALDWLPDAIGDLGDDPDVDEMTVDEAIDLLIRIVHDEPDDWIGRTLLESLEDEEGPGIARLFRAALEEVSVNIQGKAVEWLQVEEDPDALDALEHLWGTVVPDWLRRGLIFALANQPLSDRARARHLEEFIELTTDPEPGIRFAAIEALGEMADPAARPALLRAARAGTAEQRILSLGALIDLPVTDETMEALAEAVRSDDVTLRVSSINLLGRIAHPGAEPLLFAILEEDSDEDALLGAVTALRNSEHPEATATIAGLLARFHPRQYAGLGRTVLRILKRRDDVAAVGPLTHLDPEAAAILGQPLVDLVTTLSRDRNDARGTVTLTSSCSSYVRDIDPKSWLSRRISPAPPLETVRCWEAPSVPGRSWNSMRIVRGMLVGIQDYFERPGETWVRVAGSRIDCWVPLDDLVAADTPPPAPDPGRRPRIEIDLPSAEVRTTPARALLDAGLMEILEPDSNADVVAAALTVNPADPDQVALLQALSSGRRGVLDRAIAGFRRACCGPLP